MKILIAGDFCPRTRTSTLIEENRFEDILSEVQPIIESADYSLVNFECPVVESPNAKPLSKCGPNLRCTHKTVDAIKYAGFKGVTLANNHVMDFGKEGLQDTIIACKKAGLDMVGVGENLKEAEKVLYKRINGKTIAFINCCEHEFSIATEMNPGANPLNPIQQFYSIREANIHADYVIIIVHGGHEMYQLPSPRMIETYRYFIDCGADVVVNHHQHCYSGYEIYNGKPIIYGLGNFCFNSDGWREGIWTEGYMAELTIDEDINIKLHPYVQCASEPKVALMIGNKKKQFEESIKRLNAIIADKEMLRAQYEDWMKNSHDMYEIALAPYSNRYFLAAAYRGLLPRRLSHKKALRLINYIECEAHRDRLINMLYSKLK